MDILNKEIVVGDKVIYIPKHEHKIMLRYGIVTKLTKNSVSILMILIKTIGFYVKKI
jgi:hypothetical protein